MTCVGLLLQSGATTALSSERENSLFYLSTFYIDTNTFVNLEKYNVHFEQIQIDDTLQSGRTTKERTLSLSFLCQHRTLLGHKLSNRVTFWGNTVWTAKNRLSLFMLYQQQDLLCSITLFISTVRIKLRKKCHHRKM